jgi:hypothetical protein
MKSERAKVGLLTVKKRKKRETNTETNTDANEQTADRHKHTNLRLIFMESSDSEFGLLIEDPYLGFRFTVLILKIACEQQQYRNHKKAHRRFATIVSGALEAVGLSCIPAKDDIVAACANAAPAVNKPV